MTEEPEKSALDTIKEFLAELAEDDKYGPIIAAITPFLPALIAMGKEAIQLFIQLILDGNTDEAEQMVFETMTPEERLPILKAAAHKMHDAVVAAEQLSEDTVGLLLKVLLALLPLAATL